jgi:hypothetical protein
MSITQEKPALSVTLTDQGEAITIGLDTCPVNPELVEMIADVLTGFEAVISDPLVHIPGNLLDELQGIEIDRGPTNGALMARHCATQIREYIDRQDRSCKTATSTDKPMHRFLYCAALSWDVQSARLESALKAYRAMRQETDFVQTCTRVLRMLDSMASLDRSHF